MGMFKRDESVKQPETSVPAVQRLESREEMSVIGETLFVKGELFSDEEVLIEGKIEGKIKVKHRVVVGKSGNVRADIEANQAIIKGQVDGNVTCTDKVEIVPEGILNGNILSERVVLADGAVFKGSIDMSAKIEQKPAEVQEEIEPEETVEAEVIEETGEEEQEEPGETEKSKKSGKKKD